MILHIQKCDEKSAFSLINELLKVDAITKEVGKPGTDTYYKNIDVKAKYSDWEYQSFLNEHVKQFILLSENKSQYLAHLFNHLLNTLNLETDSDGHDYSWMWRNTLEDNEQTRHISGVKEYLLILLRDLSIALIKKDSNQFKVINQELNQNKYKWKIFERLSIYLSVKFLEIDLNLTNRLISNTGLYENLHTRNEYSLLLDSAFKLVSKNTQHTVYDWIEDGFDLKNTSRNMRSLKKIHLAKKILKITKITGK